MLVVGGPPVVDAVSPMRPLPPVGVRTGLESVPSSTDIFKDTMLEPAGSFLRKYAALLSGLSLGAIAAAETSEGMRRYARACMLTTALDSRDKRDLK